jgi:hypothetical protein
MNRLVLNTRVEEGRGTLRPTVDGLDLLAGYRNNEGLNPDELLPPLSRVLLPTRTPRNIVVGACSCGETGCGSLWMQVRRVDDQVLWEPAEVPFGETLSRSYRFDLVSYLNAVDAAAEDRVDEGRGRRVARMVRLALGQYDARYDSVRFFHAVTLDWVSAWPWTSAVVAVSLSGAEGQVVHEFAATADESDDEFAARICREIARLRLPRE